MQLDFIVAEVGEFQIESGDALRASVHIFVGSQSDEDVIVNLEKVKVVSGQLLKGSLVCMAPQGNCFPRASRPRQDCAKGTMIWK